jgi:hypothetical protein
MVRLALHLPSINHGELGIFLRKISQIPQFTTKLIKKKLLLQIIDVDLLTLKKLNLGSSFMLAIMLRLLDPPFIYHS